MCHSHTSTPRHTRTHLGRSSGEVTTPRLTAAQVRSRPAGAPASRRGRTRIARAPASRGLPQWLGERSGRAGAPQARLALASAATLTRVHRNGTEWCDEASQQEGPGRGDARSGAGNSSRAGEAAPTGASAPLEGARTSGVPAAASGVSAEGERASVSAKRGHGVPVTDRESHRARPSAERCEECGCRFAVGPSGLCWWCVLRFRELARST